MLRLLRGSGDETTSAEALRRAGVSRATVERLFAPFLRGVFLEERLATSSRFLDFVLRSFADGPAALPHRGMGAITAQLAEGLDVRKGAAVATVGPHAVSLESGEQLRAEAVVVATAGIVDEPPHGWNGVTCVYYDAPAPPIPGPWLVVNGEGGPVNNLCVPSEVARSYAPAGRALVSLTILGAGEPDLDAVGAQLRGWFGTTVCGVATSADIPDPESASRLSGRRLDGAVAATRGRAVCLWRPPRASVAQRCSRIGARGR